MLARLQQAIALTWLAGLLGGLWLTAGHGRPGWALALVLLLCGGHAAVLALEFWLMSNVNQADSRGSGHPPGHPPCPPVPPATRAQLWRAWWGECLSAPWVFLWLQPFCSRRWPDHLPAPVGAGRRGVLLVHGFVCNRGLWNDWLQRLTQHGVPVVAVNLEPVFGRIDDYVDVLDAAVQRLHATTGRAPVVVAHSMGGLALRCWRAQPGRTARVHHVITLGTPHHGTWLARWAFTPNARQMRLHSPWVQALQQAEQALGVADYGRFTCFYGHADNIVFPARTATLPGADNRHLPGVAHVHMVTCAEPWDELLRRLA